MAEDPICGMTVDETTSLHATRDGQTFYFCNEHCRKEFLAGPGSAKPAANTTTKTIYTCPMHPEVQQDHPGPCPKCGMALEPVDAAAGNAEGDNAELMDMTR
ncbi:MAG: heavy metal-binding domain-containing protein, partial [Luteolibacter sp.]